MKRFRLSTLVAVLSLALAAAGVGYACNVPVFRFALERWRADSYRCVVFHRGPLSDAERDVLRPLQPQPDRLPANVFVRTVDVDLLAADDSPEAVADRAFLSHVRNPQFPCLVVQYPAPLQIAAPLSIMPLEPEAIAQVMNSPARRELIRRLAAGETAVWVLLESGDTAGDNRAAELLTAELKNLEQTLELPALTASTDDALATSLPLEVKLSLLRVPRDAREEKMLVAMLLGSEADLGELSDPMVFPVFGRGRALLPLVGAGITSKNIHDAAEFLAGACSCEVKEQNPGFDLLLGAEWETLLSPVGLLPAATIAAKTGISAGEPTEAELVPIPKGSDRSQAAAAQASALNRRDNSAQAELPGRYFGITAGGLAMACVLGAVAVVALIRMRRST